MAAKIATSFGVTTGAIKSRLDAGRFQVKSGVTLQEAQSLAKQLEQLGVICSVVAEEKVTHHLAKPNAPMVMGTQSNSSTMVSRNPPPTPQIAAKAPPPPVVNKIHYSDFDNEKTGLSAAQSQPSIHLGALENAALGGLSMLDGVDGDYGDVAGQSFDNNASAAFQPAKFGPQDDDQPLTIERIEEKPKRKSPDVIENEFKAQDAAPGMRGKIYVEKAHAAYSNAAWLERLSVDTVTRYAVGLLACIFLGFTISHFYASSKSGELAKIDATAKEEQASATTRVVWETLEEQRTSWLKQKVTARNSIAARAIVIWVIVSAGLMVLFWFKIPWSKWEPQLLEEPVPH